MQKVNQITIGLAGIIQAVYLIKEFAHSGKMNELSFQTALGSIFQLDPNHAVEVYGQLSHLQYGLEKLTHSFNPFLPTTRHIAYYVFSLIRLEKKISASQLQSHLLRNRIEQVQKQVDYFSLTHPTVIANLSDIYITLASPFRFRFFISGNQYVLSAHANMNKVRALLLAAIRACVLWRQVGGSILYCLCHQSKIKEAALHLLAKINQG